MARHSGNIAAAALLLLLISVQGVGAATYSEIQEDVTKGLTWLNTRDIPNDITGWSWGSFETCTVKPVQRVGLTGFAVVKNLDRARELGIPPSSEVTEGLNFIFSKVQPDGSIWDYYDYRLCGGEGAPPTVPETSIAIMAITSTGPDNMNTVITDPDAGLAKGKTYKQVVEGAVAYLQEAQRKPDETDFNDIGGWTFGKDCWTTLNENCWGEVPPPADSFNTFADTPADQYNTGYAALGLVYAQEKFGIETPPSILTNLGEWVKNIQAPSGGAYQMVPPYGYYTLLRETGNLLIEQHLVGMSPGDDPEDPTDRVWLAIHYIESKWMTGEWQINYQTMFTLTCGLEAMDIGTITVSIDGNPVDEDWFDRITTRIDDTKTPVGLDQVYWDWTGPIEDVDTLFTEWNLLSLEARATPAKLAITKRADPSSLQAPGDVTYTFVVTNIGTSNVIDVQVTDTVLPDGTAVIVAGPESKDGGDGDSFLEPQEYWTYTATATLTADTTDIATVTGYDALLRKVTATSDPLTVPVNPDTQPRVFIDIKPGSCPNAFNRDEKGVLPVAILGTVDFDVRNIDTGSIFAVKPGSTLDPLGPVRTSYEDVATPYEIPPGEVCGCHDLNGDGYLDLTLKFDHRKIVDYLDPVNPDGPNSPDYTLTIKGTLTDGNGFEGSDCVKIVSKKR